MSGDERGWVEMLTVSKPDTAQREMARRALDAYFARTSPEQAVRNFLEIAVGASPRQKRILAELVAPYVSMGEPWLLLLRDGEKRWARRAARGYLARIEDTEAGLALLFGYQRALGATPEFSSLAFLGELTLETAKERPNWNES